MNLFESIAKMDNRIRYISYRQSVNVNPNGVSSISHVVSADLDGLSGGKCLCCVNHECDILSATEANIKLLPTTAERKAEKRKELLEQLKELES